MQKQSILLNISEENQAEALFMSKTFVDSTTKRRVYVNTLGAECVMEYLSQNKIVCDNLKNIHSITRVVEKADIADILLDNIHIDVRVVFDENVIFIPKSQKKYNLTPDIYVVVKIGGAPQALELIGYFNADIINEDKANDEYYFVSRNEISAPETLCTYIKSAKYSHEKNLTDSELLRGRELSVLTADHDISDTEFKEFMGLLSSSQLLRDSVSEYDNFETLSYDVIPLIMKNPEIANIETEEEDIDTTKEDDNTVEIQTQTSSEEDFKDETTVIDDIETTLEDFDTTDNETSKASPSSQTPNDSAIAGTVTAAGAIATGAAIAGTISSAAASTEAIELASNATDNIEEIINTFDNKKEEPAPEISIENIELDENINIEPLEINNTEIPIDMETTELPQAENNAEDKTQTDDIFDDFEEFEQLAETVPETINKTNNEIISAQEPTKEEIEPTETPEITEDLTNNVQSEDEDELFKNSEFDDIFNENNAEEPTYIYSEHNDEIEISDNKEQSVKNEENSVTQTEENDDFLFDFEDFEKAGEDLQATDAINGAEQTIASIGKEVLENSTTISNKNIRVGEIPIDINNMQEDTPMPSEHLENIYNESPDMQTEAPLRNSVMIGRAAQGSNKNKMGILAGVGTLVVLAGLSFAAMKFIKPNTDTTDSTLPPAPQPQTSTNNTGEDSNTLNLDNNKIVSMDKAQSAMQPTQPAKKMPSTSFISVRKLSWEVPDYISYNANFKQYFQSAGKSLKSGLSSDLLLANEYAYSNQIKVSVLYDKTGTFKEAKILQSSGSAQIDKIVLQSVNQTLSILKAPQSVGNDESTTVILKISI